MSRWRTCGAAADRPGESPAGSSTTAASTRSGSGTSSRTAGKFRRRRRPSWPASSPGLVAYWRFNEGTGTSSSTTRPANHADAIKGAALGRRRARWAGGAGHDAARHHGIGTSNITASSVDDRPLRPASRRRRSVSYTATGSCPCTNVPSAATGTSALVTLTGLAADTAYKFRSQATDAAGNLRVSRR